ncbi:MAG: SoxR reducing system RseC family protein [Clostridia bacterium]|nr:SoxR reducing system RseC family protein [Clostridia bacterium]
MERIGEVTAVRGEWLEITFCRPADCEKCNACHGGQKQTTLTLKGSARVGDAAIVEMPTGAFMQASMLAYAMPLACLMAGMFLGSALFPHKADLAGGAGAVLGLAISAAALVFTEKKRRANPKWKPRLTRIIPKEGE